MLSYSNEDQIDTSEISKIYKGKPPKKMAKNFTTVVNYVGGVSKFWCVNLKKVLFLELIFKKNML